MEPYSAMKRNKLLATAYVAVVLCYDDVATSSMYLQGMMLMERRQLQKLPYHLILCEFLEKPQQISGYKGLELGRV